MGASASSNVAITPFKILDNVGELNTLKSCPFETRWRIRDFLYRCKNTECMKSTPFPSEDGNLWVMLVHPTGYPHKYKGFISVYVVALNKREFHCITFEGEFTCINGVFGYPNFMFTNELTKLLNYEDELIINWKIKCVHGNKQKYFMSVELIRIRKTNILELLGDFGELLNNSELSDVDLLAADGKVFKVHKAVLAARSKVFLAMFKNNMLEHKTSIVKIEDFDGSVLEQVLNFIYTTKSEITDDNAKGMLLAADKYDIEALKRECIDYLRSRINITNAVELLEFADKYNVKDLKVKAQLFIAKNAKDITQQPDFNLASLDIDAVNDLFRQMATESKEQL